jgi:alpha-tubulin suppressor-like RCC1 family protein
MKKYGNLGLVLILILVLALTGCGGSSKSPATPYSTNLAITAGADHSLALKRDGTVWAWGSNASGQLGDGTMTDSLVPKKISSSSLSGVIAIAATTSHNLALKSDGTVWGWGHNYYGELGDGTYMTSILTPKQISTSLLSGVIAIAMGNYHSLALKSDGTVWAWGANYLGQLGDGTTTASLVPKQISSIALSEVIAITAGYYHSLALKSDGTVWTWGKNSNGQLGDGTTTNILVPKQVLSGVIAIAAGAFYSLALKSDGTVWGWGYNSYGELGDGTTTDSLVPKQISSSSLSGVNAIAAGADHSLALKSDGTVWAWGNNYCGQLGDGTTTERHTPEQVSGL